MLIVCVCVDLKGLVHVPVHYSKENSFTTAVPTETLTLRYKDLTWHLGSLGRVGLVG